MASPQIYHPSKSLKGSAASFFYSVKNDCILATIMKQSGWDEVKGVGIFQDKTPEMKATIKLGQVEIGGILDCIERNRPFKTVHDFDKKLTTINFSPYYDKVDTAKQIGYDFSFNVSDKEDSTKKDSFFIRFNLAEGRLIREHLIYMLHRQFDNVPDNSAI